MTKNNNFNIFPILLLIARPAAGKSEIINYLNNLNPKERKTKLHIGKLKVIDDFPFLWRWFEEDNLLTNMKKPRLYTDEKGYFKNIYFWDLLIRMINLEYEKFNRDASNNKVHTVIIEFSRGKEHGGYRRALPMLSGEILNSSSLLYIYVSWQESLRKNRKRFNPDKPDSILEHSLPDEKLNKLYHDCDFKDLIKADNGYLKLENTNIPFAVFNNEDDVTTTPGQEFVDRLTKNIDNLWELRNAV